MPDSHSMTVLVADDSPLIVRSLQRILRAQFRVMTAVDGSDALDLINQHRFDVVLADIRMPGADGYAVLQHARQRDPAPEVILMTGHAAVEQAVEAMKLGAFHYLTKPFDLEEVSTCVAEAASRFAIRTRAEWVAQSPLIDDPFSAIVGASRPMRSVIDLLRRTASSDATLLLTGESGTGKEIVARAIHSGSPRKDRPFVAVNCGALPAQLVESELFGTVKGAFTGAVAERRGLVEEAAGGTLFLDELGELPLPLQVKLNRMLQEKVIRPVGASRERKIDVRVIAATNVDMEKAVAEGRLREDLYYRLMVLTVHLPPLRARREDVPELAAMFLKRHGRSGGVVRKFTPRALEALTREHWPGNVRQLENVIQRALAVSTDPRIDLDSLPEAFRGVAHSATGPALSAQTYREAMEAAQQRAGRQYLVAMMRSFSGDVRAAAEQADLRRESMYRLLKRFRIRPDDFRSPI